MKRRGRRFVVTLGVLFPAAVLALNVLAHRHARAFTSFSRVGVRTARPEHLSTAQRLSVLLTGPTLPKPLNERTPADVGLPYQRLLFPGPDGHQLEAWLVPGRDGVVVMCHGYADSKESLLDPARAFAEMGWSVFMVDFRGSGGSSGVDTSLGFHEARDIAGAVAVARRISDGPLILYGVSMGAAAILRAVAVEGARASALIVEAPFDSLKRTVANRFEALNVPAFPAAHLLLFWGGVQQGFDAFSHNPVEYAARVEIPTLLMHGGRDRRVSLAESRSIFDALRGPKVSEIFPHLGHQLLIAGARQQWMTAVRNFRAACIDHSDPRVSCASLESAEAKPLDRPD